jgi:hypothetical protein
MAVALIIAALLLLAPLFCINSIVLQSAVRS